MTSLRRRRPSVCCIDPHSVKDDSHRSGQRDLHAFFPAGAQHAPPKPSSETIGLMAENDVRSFEQCYARLSISDFCDPSHPINLARLVSPGRQPEIGTHGLGMQESPGIVHGGAEGQRRDRTEEPDDGVGRTPASALRARQATDS